MYVYLLIILAECATNISVSQIFFDVLIAVRKTFFFPPKAYSSPEVWD